MSTNTSDVFSQAIERLPGLRSARGAIIPELERARATIQTLQTAPQTRVVLAQTQHLMEGIEQIPQTSYTFYRLFLRNGDRDNYQAPYFLKRARLAAAAVRLFLGQTELKDSVQDYLWSICEESNWVLPAHETYIIDLFSAETGYVLAETLLMLGETLDAEVRHRVREEIERRVFDPYLRYHHLHKWYKEHHNWNGVCNSSIAATFLLLESETERLEQALKIALIGLQAFLETAFEEDGSSTEGVAYWHYGLINFVALAEMLRARSNGAIDLLAGEKMRRIAAYPARMQLSGSWFASFSDCNETVEFHPGILMRLAERTGERSLFNLLARPAEPESDWRLTMMLRDILWWNGSQPGANTPTDARLPDAGVVRLVTQMGQGTPVVVALKAGHNAENHNQNDVGSFIVHVEGENLLTDPGRGLYSRAYFGPQRYENIFTNSYGHSLPRIGRHLQEAGREFAGTLLEVAPEQDGYKQAAVEFARAYLCADLVRAERRLLLASDVWLHDRFVFLETPHEVEEAFVTWCDCLVDGATALIQGQHRDLRLIIEQPQGVSFALERLEEQCRANKKPGVLKRLTVILPLALDVEVRIRMEVLEKGECR
ncbi:hypothetical protein KSF_071590 [Reticulibacter mediterranei]|uniref:Heparinase n=1 Tax=Reticulibacter mediterranei TaxID=2778369 RepID=A0A8J3IVV3_9CHLR|nr:heparinase II/III family protein [Reticulibacter mediterranei]GHO97111.1 hypothetical protein KSF_071590 [Reticulibacter mediterranei]